MQLSTANICFLTTLKVMIPDTSFSFFRARFSAENDYFCNGKTDNSIY